MLDVLSSAWLIGPVAVVSTLLLFSLSVADGQRLPVPARTRLVIYGVLLVLAILIAVRFYHLINP